MPRPTRRAGGGPAALVLAGAAVALLAALPLAYLLIRAGTADVQAWNVVLRLRTLELVARTLVLVVAVTATAATIGVGLAWLVVRTDLPLRRVLAVGAALPLVIPSYVAALALIAAFGPGGLLGSGTWIFGLLGSWTGLTLATYPYVYLLAAAALRRSDPALEEAARGLGRTRRQVFFKVTLPGLRPAVGAGGVLVALYTLSDFGVVSLMRYDALTRAIYEQYRSLFDRTPAALLGLVLVVLTAVILAVEARARGGGRVTRGAAGAARPAEPTPLGRWRWPALGGVGAFLVLALVVPVGTLVGWALRATAERPGGVELLGWASNSLLASAATAGVAILAALPVAALVVRRPSPLSRGLERATLASNALPGIVVALSLVFFATRVLPSVYQTLPLLVFAYAVRFLPQALSGARDALGRVDPTLEQAARGLGLRPAQTLRRVTLPLVAPGLLAGATLVFLSTMKELPATLVLRPVGFDTLATEVWSATGASQYGVAALPALALIVLSAPVVYALQLRPGDRGSAKAPRGQAGPMRLLVLSADPVDAEAVRAALGDEEGLDGAEVLVVSPAVNESALAFWVSDSDEAIEDAESSAAKTVAALDGRADRVRGEVGESEPLLALQDALATFPADRVLVFVRPEDEQRYKEDDLVGAASERFGVPVSEHRLAG